MKALLSATALIGLLASPAFAAELPTVRISTGGQGNGYWNACTKLKGDLASVGKIECLTSEGSMTNLNRLRAGEAELAIVQADAMAVAKKSGGVTGLDQLASIGSEYVQLVCNKASGITQASDLKTKSPRPKVLVGGAGSGPAVTLQNWIIESDAYRNVEPVYKSAKDGALMLKQNQVACALVVSALGGDTMTMLDNGADGKLILVDADDRHFDDSTDIDGSPVYTWDKISGSVYKNLIGGGVFSWNDRWSTKQNAYLVGRDGFTGDKANEPFLNALTSRLFIDSNLVK